MYAFIPLNCESADRLEYCATGAGAEDDAAVAAELELDAELIAAQRSGCE